MNRPARVQNWGEPFPSGRVRRLNAPPAVHPGGAGSRLDLSIAVIDALLQSYRAATAQAVRHGWDPEIATRQQHLDLMHEIKCLVAHGRVGDLSDIY